VFGVVEEPSENIRVVFHVVDGELDALLELGPSEMRAEALPQKIGQRCFRDAWIFVRDLCHDSEESITQVVALFLVIVIVDDWHYAARYLRVDGWKPGFHK